MCHVLIQAYRGIREGSSCCPRSRGAGTRFQIEPQSLDDAHIIISFVPRRELVVGESSARFYAKHSSIRHSLIRRCTSRRFSGDGIHGSAQRGPPECAFSRSSASAHSGPPSARTHRADRPARRWGGQGQPHPRGIRQADAVAMGARVGGVKAGSASSTARSSIPGRRRLRDLRVPDRRSCGVGGGAHAAPPGLHARLGRDVRGSALAGSSRRRSYPRCVATMTATSPSAAISSPVWRISSPGSSPVWRDSRDVPLAEELTRRPAGGA